MMRFKIGGTEKEKKIGIRILFYSFLVNFQEKGKGKEKRKVERVHLRVRFLVDVTTSRWSSVRSRILRYVADAHMQVVVFFLAGHSDGYNLRKDMSNDEIPSKGKKKKSERGESNRDQV